jgi:UDP-glucose 4-epimerase
METILVTGGAGFIGSNIADALDSRGFRVVLLDDLSSGRLENIDHLLHRKNVTFIRGSILDRGLLRSVLKTYQVSAISHQAAVAGVRKSILDPLGSIEANITGTANVFDIAAESCCRRVVFASSWTVYGEPQEAPLKEQCRLKPRSPYAVSKASSEMLARAFCSIHSLESIGLRYFNVYGRRQNGRSEYSAVLQSFITNAVRNEPLVLEGDGLQTRDFVYIDDVVQANMLALTTKQATGRCFNIASGTSVSIADLAQLVIRAARSRSAVVSKSPGPAEGDRVRADIQRARTLLGYVPAVSLEEGLKKTIAWFEPQAGIVPPQVAVHHAQPAAR